MKTINRIRAFAAAAAFAAATALLPPGALADEYWDQRTSLFELLPITHDDIVFLGNSITDGGEFNELFGMDNIKNRGIRSDAIPGVEKRLGQVTSGGPKKIFLLIGINDVSHGLSATRLAERYRRLVERIRRETPGTKLYLQSVMPVNNSFRRYKGLIGKEKTIRALNDSINKIAAETGCTYVDLWPMLGDAKGNLKAEYTNDGLHLNGRGYRVWTDGIRDLVKE